MKTKSPSTPDFNIYYGVDWHQARQHLKPTVEVSSALPNILAFFGYDSRGAVFFCLGLSQQNSVLITAKEIAVRARKRHDFKDYARLIGDIPKSEDLNYLGSIAIEGIEVNACRDFHGRDILVVELEGKEHLVVIDPKTFLPELDVGVLVVTGSDPAASAPAREKPALDVISDTKSPALH